MFNINAAVGMKPHNSLESFKWYVMDKVQSAINLENTEAVGTLNVYWLMYFEIVSENRNSKIG